MLVLCKIFERTCSFSCYRHFAILNPKKGYMIMANRLSSLLHMLAGKQKSFKVSDLANTFQVSTRTIYNDVVKLNELLGSPSDPKIKMEKGLVFVDEKISVDIGRQLSESDFIMSSKGSRKARIKRLVLLEGDYFSTEDIMQKTLVSRNTLISDFKVVKAELEKENIHFLSVPFKGYKVEGNENKIRNVIVFAIKGDPFLFDHTDFRAERKILDEIREFLEVFCCEANVSLSDECFERVVLLFWVAKERIKLGKRISAGDVKETLSQGETFLSKNKATLEKIFGSAINDDEILYLANKLSTASVVRYDELMSEEWLSFNLITERFILEVEKNFATNEFKYDKKLFEGLMNHLKPAYQRALFSEWIESPMYDDIASNYSLLHSAVKRSISILEEELNVFFTAHEVSFFTMLFAASLERNKRDTQSHTKAIIVCNAGISTSEIIRSQINAKYEVDVLGVFNARDGLAYLKNNKVDLVITTLDLDLDIEGVPVVQVNPLLSEENIKELAHFIKFTFAKIDIEKLMNIINAHTDLEPQKSGRLAQELSQYLNVPIKSDDLTGRYQPMLKEILTEPLIAVNFLARNREEAVRKSGELLVSSNLATEAYTEAMLENVEVNGTYIVIAPGIAMPHARSEKGSLGVGFSIVTLAEPVAFGHPANDPVRIVIGFCAVDHQTHLKALTDVMKILSDEESLSAILAASDPSEIMGIVKRGNT